MSAADKPPRNPASRAPRTPKRTLKRTPAKIDAPVAAVQIDLFPIKPIVEVLDPRKVVGESTSVEHLVRVKFRPSDPPHLVFHDRHGWYCESHGPACASVKLAQDASA